MEMNLKKAISVLGAFSAILILGSSSITISATQVIAEKGVAVISPSVIAPVVSLRTISGINCVQSLDRRVISAVADVQSAGEINAVDMVNHVRHEIDLHASYGRSISQTTAVDLGLLIVSNNAIGRVAIANEMGEIGTINEVGGDIVANIVASRVILGSKIDAVAAIQGIADIRAIPAISTIEEISNIQGRQNEILPKVDYISANSVIPNILAINNIEGQSQIVDSIDSIDNAGIVSSRVGVIRDISADSIAGVINLGITGTGDILDGSRITSGAIDVDSVAGRHIRNDRYIDTISTGRDIWRAEIIAGEILANRTSNQQVSFGRYLTS